MLPLQNDFKVEYKDGTPIQTPWVPFSDSTH